MAIDASIYQNLRPVEMPSVLDSAVKASSLSQMGMQQKRMGQEMAAADMQAHLQKASVFGNALEGLSGLRDEERAAAYPKVYSELVQSGVISKDQAPPQYDPDFYRQSLMRYRSTKDGIDGQLAQSRLDLNKSQMGLQQSQMAKNYADAGRERLERDPSKMDPAQRLGKMGAEGKQKIGFLTSGLEGLTRYEDAFGSGERQSYINPTTPLIGGLVSSTPIDEARIGLEEAIGRLASGGAINAGEEARFRKMIPTAADKDVDARRKLTNLRKDMENKLTAYGFKAGELGDMGFDPQMLGYSEDRIAARQGAGSPQGGGMVREAVAAPPKPKNGSVVDGYVFMGGDPANAKSWKRAR